MIDVLQEYTEKSFKEAAYVVFIFMRSILMQLFVIMYWCQQRIIISVIVRVVHVLAVTSL